METSYEPVCPSVCRLSLFHVSLPMFQSEHLFPISSLILTFICHDNELRAFLSAKRPLQITLSIRPPVHSFNCIARFILGFSGTTLSACPQAPTLDTKFSSPSSPRNSCCLINILPIQVHNAPSRLALCFWSFILLTRHSLCQELSKKDRKLECNEECSKLERNKRIALALQIRNPELSAKITPRYSDFMKEFTKKDPKFCSLVHDEFAKLVQLAKEVSRVWRYRGNLSCFFSILDNQECKALIRKTFSGIRASKFFLLKQ